MRVLRGLSLGCTLGFALNLRIEAWYYMGR